MKIALAQQNYSLGNLEANKTKIVTYIHQAREQGAELVVFPEYAVSGPGGGDLFNQRPFIEACEEVLIIIASHCDDICVIVGLPIAHEGKIISVAAFIENRRIKKYIGKKNIVSRDELGFISSSEGVEFVKVNGKKVAVTLDHDIYHTEKGYAKEADVILNLIANPYHRGKIEIRYNYARYFSHYVERPCCFLNHVSGQGENIYDGSSAVFRPDGQPAVFFAHFEEDCRIIDTDDLPVAEQQYQNRTANVCKALILGTKDFFRKKHLKKASVNMSGGIDSAVVLAIAVKALGADNVRALMLPSRFSSDHSIDDSIEMCEHLGVGYDVVPIDEAYEAMTDSLKPLIGGTRFDTTEEQLQARIRNIMLQAFSHKFGYTPLNTVNKSEMAYGYATLDGDCVGDLSIIGDLYKIEVYALGRYLNLEREIIPVHIMEKEPSPELRPNHKDSDFMPPYEVLDAILFRFMEEGQRPEEIVNAGFEANLVFDIVERIKAGRHKRYRECPVLRVSSRPFRNGLIDPIVHEFLIHWNWKVNQSYDFDL